MTIAIVHLERHMDNKSLTKWLYPWLNPHVHVNAPIDKLCTFGQMDQVVDFRDMEESEVLIKEYMLDHSRQDAGKQLQDSRKELTSHFKDSWKSPWPFSVLIRNEPH